MPRHPVTGLLAVAMGVLAGGGAMPTGHCGPPAPRGTPVPAVLEPLDPLALDVAPSGDPGPWSRWTDGHAGPGRTAPDGILARPIAGWSSNACAPTIALDWESAGTMRARPADVLHGLPPTERLHSPLDDGGTEHW